MLTLFGGLQVPTVLCANTTGSIWTTRGAQASMYSDRKAVNIGDLVTVVIQENATISSSRQTNTQKSSDVADQLTRLLYSAAAFGDSGPPLSRGGELPGLGWSSDNSFSGSGATQGAQSVQSRLSVMVIDRLPNGNMVIEGVRKVSFSGETNFVVLRGIIRPQDILADNSILSSRIADAEIEMVAEGAISDAERRGWLTRLYHWLNPF